MLIRIARSRDVKTPSRGHVTDAGLDFFVPSFTRQFIDDLYDVNRRIDNGFKQYFDDDSHIPKKISIDPNRSILIPSGIHVEVPYGHSMVFLNKSKIASLKNLIIGAQVIDTFYSGEVHLDLHNSGDGLAFISPGEKIAQALLLPVLTPSPIEVRLDGLYKSMKQDSHRDDGGFGSTNKQEGE